MSDGIQDSGRRLTRKDFLVSVPVALAGVGMFLGRGSKADSGAGAPGAGAILGAGAGVAGPGGPGSRATAIGVQLYTLRSVIGEDVEGTLASLVEMGYQEVEFAGLYGMTPDEMRAMLDGVGLEAASSHHGLNEVRGDWNATLEAAATLGQDLVVVPSIPGDEHTLEGLLAVAEDFNAAGEAAKAMGLRFGYHNHDWEFEPLPSGEIPLDLLLENTDPELVSFQLDLFWTVHGGSDPLQYFGAYPGRFTSVHVKDRTAAGDMVAVGDGVIDFGTILARSEQAGIDHYFVEHDWPDDPMESVRRSYNALSQVLD